MNWGNKLVIVFIVFIGMIVTMITVCMKQDVFLVSKDYYKQEIAYEDRIQEIKNAKSLGQSVGLKLNAAQKQVTLSMPEVLEFSELKGEIHFFRPSDATQDMKIELSPDQKGQQQISLAALSSGFWRVKLSWQDQEKKYYEERILQL